MKLSALPIFRQEPLKSIGCFAKALSSRYTFSFSLFALASAKILADHWTYCSDVRDRWSQSRVVVASPSSELCRLLDSSVGTCAADRKYCIMRIFFGGPSAIEDVIRNGGQQHKQLLELGVGKCNCARQLTIYSVIEMFTYLNSYCYCATPAKKQAKRGMCKCFKGLYTTTGNFKIKESTTIINSLPFWFEFTMSKLTFLFNLRTTKYWFIVANQRMRINL